MKKTLVMDNKVLMARIDLLGLGVADTAKYIENDKVLWSINQATIALQDAYRQLEESSTKEDS